MTMTLNQLNQASRDEAESLMLQACGSHRWAELMTATLPFSGLDQLALAADKANSCLCREDWLEAFSHHPRIGDTTPPLSAATHQAASAMASREQSGMAGADAATRQAFLELNRAYERQFSHVFLICATGKSASEMLAQLQTRLNNDAATEFANAVEQQKLITKLRLGKLITP